MIISEVIAKLKEKQEILGDVPVIIHKYGECSIEWWDEITGFEHVTDIPVNAFDRNPKILPVSVEIY